MKKFTLTALFIVFIACLASSQDISGDWYGIMTIDTEPTRIFLHITNKSNVYTATYDSPEDDAFGLVTDTLMLRNDSIIFTRGPRTYKGRFSAAHDRIDATFNVPYGIFPIVFTRNPIPTPPRSIAKIKETYDKKEVRIKMRDGAGLFTSIYAPKDKSERHPILLVRTPYNIEPNENAYSGRLFSMWHLMAEKYIIVFQDVRGRYMSEGTFVDVRPYNPSKKKKEVDDNSDTFDTIDWLVKNVANNNGNVGIFGISYPGFYSSMALPNAHPALKAASPQAPVGNWFMGDDWHHNGAFFLMDAFSFYSTVGVPRPEPTRLFPNGIDFKNEDNYDFYLDLGPLKNVRKKYFGDTIKFWNDLMSHPNYDDFWKARTVLPHLKNVKPAVLVVGGWFDAEDLWGAIQTYKAIESQNATNQNRFVMGPWFHGQWSRAVGENLGNIHFGSNTSEYYRQIETRFFNYYLKGKGTMDLPEASIFVTGANTWKTFDAWPPKSSSSKNLYLECNGGLAFETPAESECFDEYIADPNRPVPYTEDVHLRRTREYLTDDQRFASRRPDVMVYQTGVLEDDITFTGPLKVKLYVSTSGTDADFVVKLIDVFPDQVENYPENDKHVPMGGYQMLVRGEVMRGKYRKSFEKPEPFEPGKITEVSFEIPDVAHQFKKGHRIMIQVQNSWFPLVDRNPQTFVNIYEADEKDFVKATQRIYHDVQHPSSITVRVIPEEQ